MAESVRKVVARGAEVVISMAGSALSSSDSLPMLGMIAERYALLLPAAARFYSLPALTAGAHAVHTERYGSAVDALAHPSVSAVVNVPELGSQILVSLDGGIARIMLHSMLGGRASMAETGRKEFTHIDRMISSRLMERLVAPLTEAFGMFAKITAKVESVEVQPQFTAVLPRMAPATVIRITLECEGVPGTLSVVVPRAALDPIRDVLSQATAGGVFGEGGWLSGAKERTATLPLDIHAVIGSMEVPLGEVVGWRAGTRLELPPSGPTTTRLVSGEVTVAAGRAGQVRGRRGVLVSEVGDAAASIEDRKEQAA